MVKRYPFWWLPGMLALPIIAVSPSLGPAVLLFAIVMMILLRMWASRSLARVAYINSQIDKGVVFNKEATLLDQTYSRRKRMVLNYANVKQYAGVTQKLTFTMMLLVVFVIGYANFKWFKNPTISLGMFLPYPKAYLIKAAIFTSLISLVLLMLSCFFAFMICRYSAHSLKPENQPVDQTPEEAQEKKDASIENARESAKKSEGMIANLARKTVSEEAEEAAYKKADQAAKSGSIAAKARLDVSDDAPRMTLDEKIEAEHLAREAEKAAAAAKAEAAEAEEAAEE